MRKEATENEIIEALNNELEKNAELQDCQIQSIQMHAEDETGANWSASLRVSGNLGDIFRDPVDQIIEKFRAEYTLVE